MRTANDYKILLVNLLPRGRAWRFVEDSWLSKLFDGIAIEFERLEARVEALFTEADPRSTTELLPDWEESLALPDRAFPTTEVAQRRSQVIARLVDVGEQTDAYKIELAAKMGFPGCTITNYYAARSGRMRSGDRLTNDAWVFAYTMNVPNAAESRFRSGDRCGARLRTSTAELLELEMGRISAAHMIPLFNYEA